MATEAGLQATDTEETGEAGEEVTVIDVASEMAVFWALVAVTVTVPVDAGAVKSPLPLIEPAVAFQVTAVLYFPVPLTVAVHCDVALGAAVEGEHAAEIEDTEVVTFEEIGAVVLLPQAMIERAASKVVTAYKTRFLVETAMRTSEMLPPGCRIPPVPVVRHKEVPWKQSSPTQGKCSEAVVRAL